MIRTKERLQVIEEIKEIKQTIATEIAREVAGLSQKEVCHKTDLRQPEVSDLLSGKMKRFTIDRLLMVLIALGRRPTVMVR